MIDYAAAYTRWFRPLVAWINHHTHVAEGEDVAHDVFAEIIARGASPDKSLLFWIALRRIIDAARRARRRPAEPLDWAAHVTTPPPDIDRVVADDLLARWPPRMRLIFRLAALGYEQSEIGAALGMTKGGVNAAIIRARRGAGIGDRQDAPRCAQCDQPTHARGMCLRHYSADRYRRQRDAAGATS